ncbi:MAG: hypothetical protein H7Z43_01365, partial [Clostridia bacterium]|nr:hypothetical protein [Deltaproteobacteria bacterium]
MDADVPPTPRQLLENLLGQGMVMVTIDARADDVVVPTQFEGDPQLRLNLSYRFGLPIDIDEWGVKARLTFSGIPFDCKLPWPSIYMIVSHVTGQPFLFPEHVPPELMQLAAQMRDREPEVPAALKKPKLSLVMADEPGDLSDANAPSANEQANEKTAASSEVSPALTPLVPVPAEELAP